ncbi:MAG: S-adenosylmethionine decarboxylase [Bacteroidales bacterium]|nr:S-adenosylmethionine decarboxylase [Bacteroidales bacterium]
MIYSRPHFEHILIEIFDVKSINKTKEFCEKIEIFVDKCRLNVVKKTKYKFSKAGFTFVFILSESHIIFHSWPEMNYLNIDFMSCSPIKNLNKIIFLAKEMFDSKNVILKKYNQ